MRYVERFLLGCQLTMSCQSSNSGQPGTPGTLHQGNRCWHDREHTGSDLLEAQSKAHMALAVPAPLLVALPEAWQCWGLLGRAGLSLGTQIARLWHKDEQP
jgi:hypothetical protein